MALKIIVSYDDTDNDRDALALGRLLAVSGAELSLAYVRHSFGESLEQKQAEELLARGAASVGTPDMPRHVVVNPATSVGLTELAEREDADVDRLRLRVPHRARASSSPASRLTNCCSAARRRSPSRRPACATNPSVERQHRRRHRRGRRRRPADGRQPRRGPRGHRRRASAPARSTCSSSARAPRRRRARSCSAPPATTRSRLRPTRCWSCRAASRSSFGWRLRRRQRCRVGLTTRITAATSGSRPSIRSCASLQSIARRVVARGEVGRDRLRRVGLDHEGVGARSAAAPSRGPRG